MGETIKDRLRGGHDGWLRCPTGPGGWLLHAQLMNDAADHIDKLEAVNTHLRGAITAQDEREQVAGKRCGVEWHEHGCDWPEWVADELILARSARDKLRAENIEQARTIGRLEGELKGVEINQREKDRRIAELEAIVERLARTVDGVPVVYGDKVWVVDEYGPVEIVHRGPYTATIIPRVPEYSTEAAAREAMGGGG